MRRLSRSSGTVSRAATGAQLRALLAVAVVAAPTLVGAGYALLAALGVIGPGAAGFTTARVARVLRDPAVGEGLAWTVLVAAASTALAAASAMLVAVAFCAPSRQGRVAHALAILPLPIPHLVAAVGGLLVLGQSGFLSRLGFALGLFEVPADMPVLVYDRWGLGLTLTLAWKEFPFLALVAFSVLAGRGSILQETARGLGAGPWQILVRVTGPMLWRGLLPAVIAVFTFVAGSYEAAALLAPSDPLALPLLTLERYTDASLARRADAFVLVLVALGLSAAAVALHERVRAHWGSLQG